MASYPHTPSNKQSIIPLHSNGAAQEQNYPMHKSKNNGAECMQKDDPISKQSLLTIPQVATQLNICRAHVYKLINQGLPTIHLGRSVRVSATALHHWLQTQQDS